MQITTPYSPSLIITSCFLALLAIAGLFPAEQVTAQDPGWSPVIIATGEYRNQIKSMPIEQRPYRPLHFYGNSVRRNYYRGTTSGQVSDRQAVRTQSFRPSISMPNTSMSSAPVQPIQPQNWSSNSYAPQPYPAVPRVSYPTNSYPAYSYPTATYPTATYPTATYPTGPAAYQWAPHQHAPVQSWRGPAW